MIELTGERFRAFAQVIQGIEKVFLDKGNELFQLELESLIHCEAVYEGFSEHLKAEVGSF